GRVGSKTLTDRARRPAIGIWPRGAMTFDPIRAACSSVVHRRTPRRISPDDLPSRASTPRAWRSRHAQGVSPPERDQLTGLGDEHVGGEPGLGAGLAQLGGPL